MCFLIGWTDPLKPPIASMCQSHQHIKQGKVVNAKGSGCTAQCPTPFLFHSTTLHDTPNTAEQIISTQLERPLSTRTGCYLSKRKKRKRNKDWRTDRFAHLCVIVAKWSVYLLHLYWWNLNKTTMQLDTACSGLLYTDWKPWSQLQIANKDMPAPEE